MGDLWVARKVLLKSQSGGSPKAQGSNTKRTLYDHGRPKITMICPDFWLCNSTKVKHVAPIFGTTDGSIFQKIPKVACWCYFRPKVRDYNVRWIAPGLEVISKVSELHTFLQQQQLYLSAEIEKRVRKLEDVRLEMLAADPDQPSLSERNAAQDSLGAFFAEFRDALYRQRELPHSEPTGGCLTTSGASEGNSTCPASQDSARKSVVEELMRRNTLKILENEKPPEKIRS